MHTTLHRGLNASGNEIKIPVAMLTGIFFQFSTGQRIKAQTVTTQAFIFITFNELITS
jgi:hypothetical protein